MKPYHYCKLKKTHIIICGTCKGRDLLRTVRQAIAELEAGMKFVQIFGVN